MAKFSGALQLTDLDDFIGPSQECIKPVTIDRQPSHTTGAIRVAEDGRYLSVTEDGHVEELAKAKITLADCLACSGCVTSAEAVLVEQQSHHEMMRSLSQLAPSRVAVVSLSPQSRASLAARYNLSLIEVAKRLYTFFKRLGFKKMLDVTLARDMSLLECGREFLQRYRRGLKPNLPMLSSSCPGWICYAEKTHGTFILPYLSRCKSPQQIAGSLLKEHVCTQLGVTAADIFHVTVMPCYDKKLEASRQDFYNDILRSRDVDLVLTTGEVESLLQEHDIADLNIVEPSILEEDFHCLTQSGELVGHEGSGAGGFLHYVIRHTALELFGQRLDSIELTTRRNADFQEFTLTGTAADSIRHEVHFAAVNGFRNIQNLVQKLKRGKSPYHFVEVMACPSACLNGGGQLKKAGEEKELLSRVTELYNSARHRDPKENPVVCRLYREWLGGVGSEKAQQTLYTDYHAVEKNVTALNIRW